MVRVSGKTDRDQQLKQLGRAIRARREARGVSQEALADAAQMDRAHMGKIERGERNVTLLNLLKIAAALECRASEIMAGAAL
ncbi:MAG: helix-turn-helix transcriptional regulator [Proteobacteria bacterium]|nr:helix-turn-helix transcriptional regulator [Pseudomonadota bacterium]